MMVGDGYNDLGVMRVVGHPVAMGNAELELHAVARHRVAHVDREGLVEALEIAMGLAAPAPRESSAA
jgi:hydroxymethylpyrimidine pyrophosphatase-like HAD family hydrolase